jgi:hypothetical protein
MSSWFFHTTRVPALIAGLELEQSNGDLGVAGGDVHRGRHDPRAHQRSHHPRRYRSSLPRAFASADPLAH